MDKDHVFRSGYITEKAKRLMEAGILDIYLTMTPKGKIILDNVTLQKYEDEVIKIAEDGIKKITK